VARLIGQYELNIDDKGRLVLPSVHRPRYEAGAVVANRHDHLAIYEPAEWDRFFEQLTERRSAGELTRTEFNLIAMGAADLKTDAAGRILVPTWLREAAGIGREVLLTGAHEYLAIYPAGYLRQVDPEFIASAAAKLDSLGL